MNKLLINRCCLCAFLCLAFTAYGDGATPVAQDDAGQSAYGSGWVNGSNGGTGFGAWGFQTLTGTGNSSAGFYVATASDHPDLQGAAKDGKAFGLYANGVNFEVSSAFRAFSAPVAPGESVVVTWQTGVFLRKFDTDSDAMGSVGITLRSGTAGGAVDDYNKGARFEFGIYEGMPNYQIYDGQDDHDTGVAFSPGGVRVKITLTSADTYDLEVTTLADHKVTTLKGRKLGGDAGGTLDSFCIFDRNWETNDAYFDDFEVLPGTAPANSSPSAGTSSPAAPSSPSPTASPSVSPSSTEGLPPDSNSGPSSPNPEATPSAGN